MSTKLLSDDEIEAVHARAYQALYAGGYTGGMGGEQWDNASARAIESAVLAKVATVSAPVAYRFRRSADEKWYYDERDANWWQHEPLFTHTAPTQGTLQPDAEPVAWQRAVEWIKNNYQDYTNIASLCDAMREAAPVPAPQVAPVIRESRITEPSGNSGEQPGTAAPIRDACQESRADTSDEPVPQALVRLTIEVALPPIPAWFGVVGFTLDEIRQYARDAIALNTTENPDDLVDDLLTFVRRLVHALYKAAPTNPLNALALDYIERKGLNKGPYRDVCDINRALNTTATGAQGDAK